VSRKIECGGLAVLDLVIALQLLERLPDPWLDLLCSGSELVETGQQRYSCDESPLPWTLTPRDRRRQ
jgi:hypothetical protein